MRPLLAAALGLVAGVAHTAPATPKPQTLYVRPHGEITAFAQDGPLVAWFAKGKPCNTVHVLSLANGLQVPLPTQGTARNVTCKWDVGSNVGAVLSSYVTVTVKLLEPVFVWLSVAVHVTSVDPMGKESPEE